MSSEYHNEDRYCLLSKTVEGALRRGFGRFSGVVLLIGVTACWLSVLSWSVTDPSLTHATREAAQNLLGYPGAVVSDLMLQTFGITSAVLLLAPMFWGLELSLKGSVAGLRWKVLSFAASLLLLAGAFSIIPKFLAWPLNHGFGGIAGDGIAAVAIWGAGQVAQDFAKGLGLAALFAAGMFFALASTGVSAAGMWEAVSEVLSGVKQPTRRRRSAQGPRKGRLRKDHWFPALNAGNSQMQVRRDVSLDDARHSGEPAFPRWRQEPPGERHWGEPAIEDLPDLGSGGVLSRQPVQAGQLVRDEKERHAEACPTSRQPQSMHDQLTGFASDVDEGEEGFADLDSDFDANLDRDCRAMAKRFQPKIRSGHRTVMREILRNATLGLAGRGEREHEAASVRQQAPLSIGETGMLPANCDEPESEPIAEVAAPIAAAVEESQGPVGKREEHAGEEPIVDHAAGVELADLPELETCSPERTPKGTVRKPGGYCRPSLILLKSAPAARPSPELTEAVLRGTARLLEDVLERFGVKGAISEVRPGPVVTVYEVQLAKGSNPMRVVGLADDIGRAMSAGSVRVAAMPLAGGDGVVVEMANVHRRRASLRDLLSGEAYRSFGGNMPVALGYSTGGQPVVADLGLLGNVLIAGRESTGKSSLLRSMVMSLVYRSSPEDCRLMLFDPKLLEFGQFNGAPHLICPVLSDTEKMIAALEWVTVEIDERAQRMARLQARSLEIFNNRVRNARKRGEMIARSVPTGWCERTGKQLFEHEQIEFEPMPQIFLAIDELCVLMSAAPHQCEQALVKIAKKGRAVGIHLAAGTKTTSGLCLTERVRSAVGTSVAFKLGSKVDSRLVVGEPGAEQLLEQGDAILSVGHGRRMRIHTPLVSQEEVEAVAGALRAGGPSRFAPSLMAKLEEAVEPCSEQMAASPAGVR